MAVELNPAWILAVLLMASRLGGVLIMSPVLGFSTVPAQVRVIFVLLLAIILASPSGIAIPQDGIGLGGLGILIGAAFLQGALIGAALRAAVAAFGFGGQLLDFQIGFSAAAILNPSTQLQSSLISTTLEMLGALLFLLLDMHHLLLKGIAESFRSGPLTVATDSLLQVAIDQSALLFVYGLALVMPIVVGLFLLDVTIAVVSRSMPQINIYFVALPIKAFTGLALLSVSIAYVVPLTERRFSTARSGIAAPGP